jgi:PHD/YefM family antitoxin component YafN of YafNO toxin-antitoxin module
MNSKNTETISYLKAHAHRLDLSDPLIITQNGKPVYVVVDYDEHMKQQEAIAIIKMREFGRESKKYDRFR